MPNQPPSRSDVVEIIESIINSSEFCKAVAGSSYWHPLGFFKCVVPGQVDGRFIRIHYWPPAVQVMEDVHSHRSGFVSSVMYGSITQEKFELINGDELKMIEYKYNSSGEVSAVQAGFRNLRLTECCQLDAGSQYSIAASELHRIRVPEEGAVTASSWEVPVAVAIVLKERGASVDECCHRGLCEADDLVEIATQIKLRIGAP
ncbi:hypothetical protein [Stenotrophomonas sp.]|uniref:hypothetical protein n=1 Tax=Stenotrophomonas sp. TaxID=69392 RepID=UPI0028ADBE9B|nr:hypothetical protein [Stenotrophomonas sp.]